MASALHFGIHADFTAYAFFLPDLGIVIGMDKGSRFGQSLKAF
jgi:hypothetical protein